ncbi:NB-ARC domain-containing protein [Segatella copri]|uniref:NB-ARC domain-containing protein n=1 Tax=Segatella copri TaxID=165179 RepID=UPI00294AA661|nr:NB-ARC domain-containing protein [Segatella copri]
MAKEETRMLAKQFKNAIVRDMSSFNGTQFEDFCQVLLRLILNDDDILHKGCNLNGKPVSYAVDIKTEDCKIVGQSGTDTDYFSKADFEKPMGDIRGTEKNNPLCEVLYLFSNQRASDAQHTGLATKINAESPSFEVKIYDVEKIAETIYENVNAPRCNEVWQYLTESSQFYDIFPKRNCIPQSSLYYVQRDKESKAFQALLETQSIVEIVGVSGIGKSEFAKQVTKDISQNFESLFWINGSEYKSLDSVKLCRFGYEVNLRFVLENYKSLVIVDNLNENVAKLNEDFQKANKHESKCIITSLKQSLSDALTYKLPCMEDELICKYIDSFGLSISETERKKLVTLVAGYPLAVNMICASAKDDLFSIGELLSDGALQKLEDEHNQRLSERIVRKIYDKYAAELNLLSYIDCQVISSDFLRVIVDRIRLKYLCRYSVLQQEDAYTFRIHQVVLDAIKCIAHIPDLKELADKLSCYLDNKNHQKDIPFFTLFHHNVSFIDKVYHNADTTEEQKKVILYSRLQAENTFSDPLKYLSLINELTLQPANSLYDCLLQADKNEIELSATKREEFSEKAKNIIVDLESELKKTTDENIKFELLHHIGKLYVKLREGENAKPYFENALMVCPKAYATMLQLAKIAHNSKPSDISKAKEYVSTILDDNIKGHDVPLTIVLACYSVFLSKKAYSDLEDKYIESNFENFSNVIMNSLLNFNNQAVPTLGSFAYSFAYIKPEFMRRTFELLQKLPAASSDNVYIRACANLKAVEYKLEIDKKSDKAKTIFKEAEYYFELLNLKEKEEGRSKDYMRKRYQELLMDAEEWKQALEFSANFDDKDSEFYYQNVAKIYQNLQDYPLAIENIDKAIAKVSDTDYKSSFLWNKACILYDMGDKESLKILQEAIDMRKEDKAKDEWKEMLNKWTMNFKPKADVNI